jgi:Arc/MetJ-type ribon-helix-helix transcriptional regulator
MPRSKDTRGINVTMTDEERDTVKTLAKQLGFKSAADYIRSLIEADASKNEVELKFSAKWGGSRTEGD